jgi:hypothetical protein
MCESLSRLRGLLWIKVRAWICCRKEKKTQQQIRLYNKSVIVIRLNHKEFLCGCTQLWSLIWSRQLRTRVLKRYLSWTTAYIVTYFHRCWPGKYGLVCLSLYLLTSVFLSFFFLYNDPWLPIIFAAVSFLKLNISFS